MLTFWSPVAPSTTRIFRSEYFKVWALHNTGRRSESRLQNINKRLSELISRLMALTAEVDRKEINNELGDLHRGQVLLPLFHLERQRQNHSLAAQDRDAPKSSGHQRLRSSSNLSQPNADQKPRLAIQQAKSVTHT